MPSHPVDVHVGKRLRARRTLLGMSQESLGEAVGVTFQQIQKYEKGFNRIGSSRLYEFSRILDISVSYFFEEMDESSSEGGLTALKETSAVFEYNNLGNKEILTLVRAYNNITDVLVRKRVLSLIKVLSFSAQGAVEDQADVGEEDVSDVQELESVG